MILQIPLDWWVWRGFRHTRPPNSQAVDSEETFTHSPELNYLGRTEASLKDPMDAQDFHEERAFPLLKPSIHVLGTPRRSRKQRGWYQVRSPSGPAPVHHVLAPGPVVPTTEFPQELISKILGEIDMSGSRHELASCARVCHYWARTLQPELFRTIRLATRGEMERLLEIYRNSLTNLPQFDSGPRLKMELGDAPFAHRLPGIKNSRYFWVYFMIGGPLPASCGRNVRSIHGTLPRTLPHNQSRGIGGIYLYDINFRSFMHLTQLLAEVPRLTGFTGTRLKWKEESTWPDVSQRHTAIRRCIVRDEVSLTLVESMPGQRWLALFWIGLPRSALEQYGVLVRQLEERLGHLDKFSTKYNRHKLSELRSLHLCKSPENDCSRHCRNSMVSRNHWWSDDNPRYPVLR